MGLRGPAPKSNLKLTGNGAVPAAGHESTPVEIPEPLEGLSPLAAAHWRELMPQLLAHEKWEPLYVGMFSTLCEAYAEMVAIKNEINEGGWTEHGNRGLKKNPLAQTFNDSRNAYRMFAREFGLSPLTVNRAEKSAMSQKPDQSKLRRLGLL